MTSIRKLTQLLATIAFQINQTELPVGRRPLFLLDEMNAQGFEVFATDHTLPTET